MQIIINPGTEPVAHANEVEARKNIRVLIKDAGVQDATFRRVRKYDDGGRFYFDVSANGRTCDVLMPGLPLERVRFIDAPDQNIWHFPRLYVGGSSWVWKFAKKILHDHLMREGDDE